MSERRKVKTEHAGGKNGGGFWGRRAEAKAISKKVRRARGKEEVRDFARPGEDEYARRGDRPPTASELAAVDAEVAAIGKKVWAEANKKKIRLSRKEAETVDDLLRNPPPPTPALRAAVERMRTEGDALLAKMQTPEARAGMKAAFDGGAGLGRKGKRAPLMLFGVEHTRIPCKSCMQSAGFIRRETIMPIPAAKNAPPLAIDPSLGSICYDCHAAGTLVRMGLTWEQARIAVGNDRQEKLRLPHTRYGLQFVRRNEPGDIDRLHKWQDVYLPKEEP